MTAYVSVAAAAVLMMMGNLVPAVGFDRARDESEIRRLQGRQQDAWNRHDAAGYAALFTDGGDVVNVVGWRWKGRQEIERQLTAAYAVAFRESRLIVTDVDVTFLSRDIALAHVRWTMTGARTPPSIPEPRQGIQLQVLQKHGGEWRIAAFQNTNSVPEVPFPH